MYQPHTLPFAHQRETFERTKDEAAHALFLEQGTGKTKILIDTAGHLWHEGKIDGVVVVAPDGVHRNWIVEELPKHMAPELLERCVMHCFQTSKKATKTHQRDVQRVIAAPADRLGIMAMSVDSVMTKEGKAALWAMLRDRRCLYIVDESSRIKNPGAKRTKRIVSSGVYAPYRRIANGTPVPNSPFDVYSQIKFLDEDYWKRAGISTFAGFKTTFGVWVQRETKGGRTYPELSEFIHLDRMKQLVDRISTRVTKEDVLDLPPKIYSKSRFELTAGQRRVYNEIRDEFMTLLQSGELLTASLAIVRLLRLQQVACGYLPADDDQGPLVPVDRINPRLDLLDEIVADLPHKAIIWARFKQDIVNICERLAKAGRIAVRYDGSTSDEDRAEALERFQRGDAEFFVANPAAAGTGLTLTAAKTVIYYSNDFNLMNRLQSEDRAHRIGQDQSVHYIDIIADDTVDWRIVGALRSKQDIANMITGDSLKTWL